jgi:hypothetical protein
MIPIYGCSISSALRGDPRRIRIATSERQLLKPG